MANILVIDDDAGVRRLLRIALERHGHKVLEARNGAEGVMLYRMAAADLVITDLFMPEQDGIETIQQLRADFPQCRLLAISGGASTGAEGPLTDAQLFGADATLAKPFTIDALDDVVAQLLAR